MLFRDGRSRMILVTYGVLWRDKFCHKIHLSSLYPFGAGWFFIEVSISLMNPLNARLSILSFMRRTYRIDLSVLPSTTVGKIGSPGSIARMILSLGSDRMWCVGVTTLLVVCPLSYLVYTDFT